MSYVKFCDLPHHAPAVKRDVHVPIGAEITAIEAAVAAFREQNPGLTPWMAGCDIIVRVEAFLDPEAAEKAAKEAKP